MNCSTTRPPAFFENFRWLVFMGHSSTKYIYISWDDGLARTFSLLYLRSSLLPLCLLAWLFIIKPFFMSAIFVCSQLPSFSSFLHAGVFWCPKANCGSSRALAWVI